MPKKCRACPKHFDPRNSMQVACSPKCALKLAKGKTKNRKRETKLKLQSLKPRSKVLREAQAAFNAWIRERDHDKPCISCGRSPDDADLATGSRWDAGHYRSIGANPELRFEPLNCHRQCVKCNRFLSGNAVNYRNGLRERIGDELLEWLEGPHEPQHYTKEQLEEKRDYYRAEARRMKRERLDQDR